MEPSKQQPSQPSPSYNTEADPYAVDSLFGSGDEDASEYQDNPDDESHLYNDDDELFVEDCDSNQPLSGNQTANGTPPLAENENDDVQPPVKKRKISNRGKSQAVKKSRSKSGQSKTARAKTSQSDSSKATGQGTQKAAVKGADEWSYSIGYDPHKPPLFSVPDWFQDLTANGVVLGLPAVIKHLNGRSLRVATMCSGTESPILALNHVSQNLWTEFSLKLELEHVFSAEIVPFKQAFIERTFKPPIIFRDITELSKSMGDGTKPQTATTAYGGKVVVPSNLDLLIAGFVCSDYSHLNNRPKVIEDRGESGDTFFAIKDYCEKYTPKLVILENVISIPWTDEKARNRKNGTGKERGLDSHFTEIGYVACHVILDTKNYYVPQTRQRGYLIAVHRASFAGLDAELSSLFDKWTRQVREGLRRDASVPAECLLLKSDDPKLKFAQVEEPDQRKKATEWERCKRGHEKYRFNIKIGSEHPVTNWAAGGFKQLLDYTKPFKGATERVLDTLDIAHLRAISRGYDDRYFNRLLELSQNSYRITDTTRSGLAPCITPTGFPWMTIRGGGTTGYEALQFQALDTNNLDTTNMTQVELRNLAGNAMTSTVVGAVLVSALNVFHKILRPGNGAKAKELQFLSNLVTVRRPMFTVLRIAEYKPLSVDEAQKLAAVSCRLCYCEGRTAVATGPFQRCTICMHTSCTQCGKKPRHAYTSYVPSSHRNLLPRITPFTCAEELKQFIPSILRIDIGKSPGALHFLDTMSQNRPQDIDKDTWLSTVEAAEKALCSDVYYREMVRRESLHVHFSTQFIEGLGARLELVISDRRVELLLYATVPSAEPLSSKRRKYLEKFVLARLRPQGNDIFKGIWDFHLPKTKLVNAVIKAKGDLVDSYKVKVGLENLAEKTRVWNKFSLEFASDDDIDSFQVDITGDYEHSPECGQAYDSLYVRVGSKGDPHPTFMLFDHEKSMRNPLLDSFVFTDDTRRLEYGEYRQIFGRLDPKFHPSGSTVRIVDVTAQSANANSAIDASINSILMAVDNLTPGYEEGQNGENQNEDGLSLPENTTNSNYNTIDPINDAPDSKAAKNSVANKNGPPAYATAGLAVLLNEVVTERNVVIYRETQWVSCPPISLTPLETCDVKYHHLEAKDPEEQDLKCISQRAIFWCKAQNTCSFNNRWVRGKWTELNKCSEEHFFKEFHWLLEKCRVIPGHCRSKSGWHPELPPEQPCYSCAPKYPTLLWTYTDGNKQAPFEDPNDACIYEHRVKARPQPFAVRYQIDNEGGVQIQVGMNSTTLIHRALGQLALTGSTKNTKVSWRLITDDDPLSKPDFAPLVLLNSDHEYPAPQPTGVTKHALRIEQLRNLAWAINQERQPQPFVEEFIVEDRITHLKYRAEGKAARQVVVPSGILAHEVGFGKTLMVLSLVDSQSVWDEQQASCKIQGRITTKATLVCCPPHLASQWNSEAQKFLPDMLKGDIICVNTFQKLKGLTIKQILEAKLIIVNWNLLQGESYTLAQAQFAGMVEPDTGASDRAFRSWYNRALEMIGRNVEELKARPATFGAHINDLFTQDKATTQSTHAVIPSKRLTGAAYRSKSSASITDATATKRKQLSKAPSLKERGDTFNLAKIEQDYTEAKCPLLELFLFARVVIDEYTYLADGMKQACMVLELIGARHKWLLSGTPALSGFSDIKQIAKLIGINLGIDDYTLMKSDVLSRERKAMTRSEEFLMYKDAPSPAWQEHRHSHAQAFLNHFVRKDLAMVGYIPSEEHVLFIDQPAAVKATYHELMQYLTDTTFDLTKRVKSHHHKSKLIHDALFQCHDAEEVLIQRAAASHAELVEGAVVSIDSLGDKIIEIRMDDYLQTKAKLEDGYRLARWINTTGQYDAGFFESFRKNVNEDRLGDSETANDIKTLILEIELEPPIEPSGLPEDPNNIPTLRQLSISLSTLFTKLIDIKRSLRFAQGVHNSCLSLKTDLPLECFKCGCKGNFSDPYVLLSQCGHMVCNRCLPGDYDTCHGPTCLAGNSHYNKVLVNDLASGELSINLSKAGKIYDVVDLIKNEIPADEKVLVFVQFPKVLKAVQAALKEENIDFCDLQAAIGSWKVLSQFQKAGSGSKRVMILNIGDASASGSNLTMANHIIFVSPYHTKGSNAQYTYDAAMTQAVGRARRFGQQKMIHTYHFLVKYTADIDIMELRTSCIIGTDTGESALSVDGSREGSIFGTAFYNHISRDFN